ncbi:PPM-type phosphatase domain superfamily, partial [Sesbania bispinosa]
GIAKRLVRAALQVAAKKKEIRYDDLKKIDKGIRRNFHNDITVVVIYLDHHNHNLSTSKHRSTTAPLLTFTPQTTGKQNSVCLPQLPKPKQTQEYVQLLHTQFHTNIEELEVAVRFSPADAVHHYV